MSIKITGDAEKKNIRIKNTLTQITREGQTKAHTYKKEKQKVQIKSLDLMEKVNQMKVYFVVDMLLIGNQKEDDDHYQID